MKEVDSVYIEEIKNLLSSTNIDDVALGIIIGMKKEILLSLFYYDKGINDYWYSRHYATPKRPMDNSIIIVLNEKLFYACYNGFIGTVIKEKYKNFMNQMPKNIIKYNDGSIPEIQEGI